MSLSKFGTTILAWLFKEELHLITKKYSVQKKGSTPSIEPVLF